MPNRQPQLVIGSTLIHVVLTVKKKLSPSLEVASESKRRADNGGKAKASGRAVNQELVWGSYTGNARMVASALRRGASPNTQHRGRSALIYAVQERHLPVVKALVRAGASLDRRDSEGFTALGQAVGEGDLDIVKFLLKAGANVDGRTGGGTALHTTCAYQRLAIAKVLLAHGADPIAPDADGRLPISFAKSRPDRPDSGIRNLLKEAIAQRAVGKMRRKPRR